MGLLIKRILLHNSELSMVKARSLLLPHFPDPSALPSKGAFYRYLKSCGWRNVKSIWEPPTSPAIRQKRLPFVEKWLVNGRDTLGHVIWSDETMVQSHPNTCREKHWVPSKNLRPVQTKKHSGGFSQMFWGYISRQPLITIDGTMDQYQYKEVLENVLLPELEYASQNFQGNWQIMQDNCPAHRAKTVTQYLHENGVEFLEWPPYSPDLNPIENIWNWM
jgi:hypothetical protein